MITARKTYSMLGHSALWETARQCCEILEAADLPHAIVGGVAVCLHGYRRNTVDVDLLIRHEDADSIRRVLLDAEYRWNPQECEFRSPHNVQVKFLLAEAPAGRDSSVRLPQPSNEASVTTIENLPVVELARLIEMKIACGQGSVRRTHRDFADVIELIVSNGLRRDYARFLNKTVRKTFRQLVLSSRGKA